MADETVLACVTDQMNSERLIRRGREEADRLGAQLLVLHVRTAQSTMMGNPDVPSALNSLYALARGADAEMEIILSWDVEDTIVSYAREHRVTLAVVGRSPASAPSMGINLQKRLNIPVIIID